MAERLEAAWTRRINAAAEWNAKLDRGEIRASALKRLIWDIRAIKADSSSRGQTYKERRAVLEEQWRKVRGRKKASLAWTLNDVFGWSFWLGGIFKVHAIFMAIRRRMTVQTGDRRYFPNDGATPSEINHIVR